MNPRRGPRDHGAAEWRHHVPPRPRPTELLILACREGHTEAFRALVSRWQEPLWRHAYRLTGRDDAAWDVLQEAWLSIAGSIAGLADPASFKRWAYTIVTRRAADWVRQQANGTVPLEDIDAADAVADEEPPPSDAIELLRAALRRLPRPERMLLSLRHVDGFDMGELAEILGVPEGTVKSRLFHARQKLRDIIERMQR